MLIRLLNPLLLCPLQYIISADKARAYYWVVGAEANDEKEEGPLIVSENKKLILPLLAIILLAAPLCLAGVYSDILSEGFALVFYAAPDGNDDAPGTKTQPWRTLDGARKNVRKIKAKKPDRSVTVLFRNGFYHLKRTVVFGLEDSGTPKQPIAYKAYWGETPTFTSGLHITAWKKIPSDDPAYNYLPQTARENVLVADVPTGLNHFRFLVSRNDPWLRRGMIDVGEGIVTPNFFENNKFDDRFAEQLWDAPELKNYCLFDKSAGNFSIPPKYLDLRIWTADWSMNMLPVASIEKNVLKTTAPGTYALTPIFNNPELGWDNRHLKDGANLVNLIEGIDAPGKWAVNPDSRKVYLWPGAGETSEIYAPALTELVRIEGDIPAGRKAWKSNEPVTPVRHITFDGLTFTNADSAPWEIGDAGAQHDWAMLDKANALLRLRAADDCTVKNCIFRKTGGVALRLDLHARNNTVADCIFEFLGAEAIHLGGYGAGKRDENRDNFITHNIIAHTSQIKKDAHAITIWQSGFNRIRYNYIHHVPYCALLVAGPRYRAFIFDSEPEAKFVSMREGGHPMQRFDELGDEARFTLTVGRHIGDNVRIPTNQYCDPNTDGFAGRDRLAATYRYNQGNLIQYNAFSNIGDEPGGRVVYISGTAEPGERNKFLDNYIFDCRSASGRLDFIFFADAFSSGARVRRNVVANSNCKEVCFFLPYWKGYPKSPGSPFNPVANAFYKCNRAPIEADRAQAVGTLFYNSRTGMGGLDSTLNKNAHAPDSRYLRDYVTIRDNLKTAVLPGPRPLPHTADLIEKLNRTIQSIKARDPNYAE